MCSSCGAGPILRRGRWAMVWRGGCPRSLRLPLFLSAPLTWWGWQGGRRLMTTVVGGIRVITAVHFPCTGAPHLCCPHLHGWSTVLFGLLTIVLRPLPSSWCSVVLRWFVSVPIGRSSGSTLCVHRAICFVSQAVVAGSLGPCIFCWWPCIRVLVMVLSTVCRLPSGHGEPSAAGPRASSAPNWRPAVGVVAANPPVTQPRHPKIEPKRRPLCARASPRLPTRLRRTSGLGSSAKAAPPATSAESSWANRAGQPRVSCASAGPPIRRG